MKKKRNSVRGFWDLVNQEPLNKDRMNVSPKALRRVFLKYFVGPQWASLLLVFILSCCCGTFSRFFYAWCGRFIADDIVEVQKQAEAQTSTAANANIMPSQRQQFDLESDRERKTWQSRHAEYQGKPISEKTHLIGILAGLLVLVLVAEHSGLWLMRSRHVAIAQRFQYRMRHRLYQKLHALPMSYHDKHSAGKLMTHLFSDVRTIQQVILHMLRQIPMNVVTIIVGLTIMFAVDARLTLLVLLALPAYAVSYTFFHRRLKTVHQNLREREGRLNGHIANRIRNFYLVKSFVRETHESLDFLRRARPILRDTLASSVLGTSFSVVCGIISGVCMVAVLWIGALRVQNGEMTLGTLLMFYGSAGLMFSPIASLSNIASQFHQLCACCQKVMRVMDAPISLADPSQAESIPNEAPELEFRNVTLQYDENSGREAAIQDLSFTLPAGRTVCVMGSSGSGKTTLAKLAGRVYDPSKGEVLVNGTDIRRFKLAELRNLVGFVNQEPIIFDGTIRENIRYGSEQADTDDMVTAAQFAQIHEFIERLPEQYRTVTTERGLTLSGGQKQRVNLARVLLYEPKLLILDDCTSALDADTEVKLIQGFETVLKGRTAMLVSHRISIAMRCDYVLILHEGHMVEFGPPGELLTQDGAFREMYHEQTNKDKLLPFEAEEG